MLDIGSLCTNCGRDTAMGNGNGLFVDRIPSETDTQSGWMCVECQLVKCDRCNKETINYTIDDGFVFCDDCYKLNKIGDQSGNT